MLETKGYCPNCEKWYPLPKMKEMMFSYMDNLSKTELLEIKNQVDKILRRKNTDEVLQHGCL